ncbi:MAG: hydrogenase [Lachnospiraceae bacterium]|nr:hydrogenase [Lachnospiraceae bacterium]
MANFAGHVEQPRYTCALGALQTVVAIPRAVPILHSGPGCGDMITGFFDRSGGYAGDGTIPCTNFNEKDVVFGAVDKLRKNIQNCYKVLDTDLQVVLTGCTGGIVGDDIQSVVQEFQDAGKPIVAVDTPGFKCNNYVSHSHVVNAIIDQYVDKFLEDNPERSERNTVNLFASIPYQDDFWKGNLREYKRLLEGLGLKVHVLFGAESEGVSEWQQIPRANFNILVSPWYGKPIVDHLKTLYGQDYTWYHSVPIGANATEDFLRQVLDFAFEQGANISRKAAELFIQHEVHAYYSEIDHLASFITEFRYGLPRYAQIIQDAGYVVGLARFLLHEVSIVPEELIIADNTPEKYQEAIRKDVESISEKRRFRLEFEPDAGKAQQILRDAEHHGRGIILGAGWEKDVAIDKGADFLSIASPSPIRLVLTTNYVGFSGGLRLIEDIYMTALSTYYNK